MEKSKSIKNEEVKKSGSWGWIAVLLLLLIAIGTPLYLSSANNWVLKVNGIKTTKPEYKYFFYSNAAQIEAENGIDATDIAAKRAFWDSKNIDGIKYEEVLRDMTIQSIKEYKVFASLAAERGITVTDEEKEYFKGSIDEMITNNFAGKRIEADKALDQYYDINTSEYLEINLNLYLAYEKALSQIQTEEMTKQKALVTQEEVDKTYAEKPQAYDTVTVRHILFRTTDDQNNSLGTDTVNSMKLKAQEMVDRIGKGEDMIALTTQYSQDPSAAQNQGVFKYNKLQIYDATKDTWGQNTLVPEFSNWGLSAAVNDIGIVETAYGYHVMRLESREPTTTENAKTMIINDMASLKLQQEIESWFLETKYEPVINTKVIEKIKPIMK